MIRAVEADGAAPGESVALEVRRPDLRDGASIRFDDPASGSRGRAGQARGNGVRTLKARVTVPADAAPGPLGFRVVDRRRASPTPGGPGRAGDPVGGRGRAERPLAQAADGLGPGRGRGGDLPGDDVDVFAVDMKAGETLVAEAIAARAGSRLDAWVTIFSPDGRELASDDDLFGRDAAAWATVPASGRYLVTIQDANGRNRDGGSSRR